MVGGSVSGRPFNPDPTSYEMTGIPCGNPQRYKSTGVVRMVRDKNVPYETQSVDEPGQGTVSEAQQHLQEMLDKQLSTQISVESQTRKRKKFTQGMVYKDFGKNLTGSLTLEQFKDAEETNKQSEDLQLLGLTQDEVEFKLEHQQVASKPAKRGKYGQNPASIRDKLEAMDRKIEEKKHALSNPDIFSNARVMSRHLLEVEKSLNAGTEKANTLSHLVTMETYNTPEDQALLEVLNKHNLLGPKKESYSRPDQTQARYLTSTSTTNHQLRVVSPASYGTSTASLETSEDRADDPQECRREKSIQRSATSTVVTSEDRSHNGTPSSSHGLSENGTVTPFPEEGRDGSDDETECSSHVIEPVPVELIVRNKMSVDEIKSIPRFQNYSPGRANKTLYLKNLAKRTKEEDLVSLFIRFQKDEGPKLVFKLMTGRMKGQAFVTFPDLLTAKEAFDLVNGYKINGKPIIIEYGKKKD